MQLITNALCPLLQCLRFAQMLPKMPQQVHIPEWTGTLQRHV